MPDSPASPPDPADAGAPARIGVFDSGIGGLSVVAALQRQLPGARLSYLADSRHTPWGDKPPTWVTQRSLQLAGHLIDGGAELVLVACNTATTLAIAALRQRWPAVPFVGVEPGIKPAAAHSRNGRVAVMATTGTLRSKRLQRLLDDHAGHTQVLRLPCPGLVDAIEQTALGDDAALDSQLDRIAEQLQQAEVDTVVLGCTHYPLVAAALQQRLGPGVHLLDTAEAIARRVAQLLGPSPVQDGQPHAAPLLMATAEPGRLTQAAARWLPHSAQAQLLDLPEPVPSS